VFAVPFWIPPLIFILFAINWRGGYGAAEHKICEAELKYFLTLTIYLILLFSQTLYALVLLL